MNFLICSKVSIPAKDRTLPAWEYLRSLGHTVQVEGPGTRTIDDPDVVISMGITVMEETFNLVKQFPDAPLFCYNWDCYSWCLIPGSAVTPTNPKPIEYDYMRYGELLKKADEVWVPSVCTGKRATEWWGIENWHVILSACPWWDWDNIADEGYALCCLREIPDPWWGMFEKCCMELKIPFRCTKHECSYEEYQKAVAHCQFLCAPLYELSTGGLSLMEGYYHGKPCLISDSEWNGGIDYMGTRGSYFNHGDEDHFKYMLIEMHNGRGQYNVKSDQRRYITENFTDARMMDDMLKRIELSGV